MMSPKIILGIVIAALVVAGVFFASKYFSSSVTLPGPGASPPSPPKLWIEVDKPSVFERTSGAEPRKLGSGDELTLGGVIETDATGFAAIHFPDGSIARLEPDTKISIDEASFNKDSGKLVARMSLSVGRVWSRVLQLLTPDSLWEVKTANAVATVRGTSFGTSFFEGRARVVVLEEAVLVRARDPETGNIIPATDVKVFQDKFVAVSTDDIKAIKEGKKIELLDTKAAPPDVQGWLKRNEELDKGFEKKLEELEAKNLNESELRLELQKQFFEEAKKEGQANVEIEQISPTTPDVKATTSQEQPPDTLKEQSTTPPTQQEPGPANSLEIVSSQDIKTIFEGDTVSFQAIALTADGKRIDVTQQAKWQVIGDVGSFIAPGKFAAKLGASLSEVGFGVGQVAASWREPASGKEFFGSSPIFSVQPPTPQDIERLKLEG